MNVSCTDCYYGGLSALYKDGECHHPCSQCFRTKRDGKETCAMFTVTPVDATEICELRRERDKALANYQFMVERAADEKLDGYRELGARAAQAENERDFALKAAADARLAFEALEERLQAISEEAILAQVASELCDKVDDAMVSRRSGDDLGEHAAWLEGEVVRLTKERDNARARARQAAQVIIDEIGADGPQNVEIIASRAAKEIDRLRTEMARLQIQNNQILATSNEVWAHKIRLVNQRTALRSEVQKLESEVELLKKRT